MQNDEFETPAAEALKQFRDRVANDTGLPETVKSAVLEDIAGASPHAFERLEASLDAEAKPHENLKAKG